MKGIKDSRMKYPLTRKEVASDRDIPLSGSGGPQICCVTTKLGVGELSLELTLILLWKKASHDGTAPWRLLLRIDDLQKDQEPLVFNDRGRL